MRNRRAAFLAILIVVVMFGSVGAFGADNVKQLGSIQVGIYPITGYLPDYVARDKGFFAKNGLTVTLVGPALAGSTALQLMAGNKLQTMGLDMFTALQAEGGGNPVKVIACVAPRSIYVAVSSKKSNLPPLSAPFVERMKALEGKTVAVTAIGAGTDRALVGGLANASVATDKVHRIGIGAPAAAIAQFGAGKIDAYVTGSYSGAYQIMATVPDTQMFVDFGDTTSPPVLRTFAQGVWIASGQWVKEHPEQVTAYRNALIEAVAWIDAHPSEAADVMNADMFDGHDLATAKKSVDIQIADYYKPALKDLRCGRQGFDAATKIYEEQGLGSAGQFKFEDLIPSMATAK